ncbi:MAG: type II secretion system protein [Candidatus Paceibacterota bacterium]
MVKKKLILKNKGFTLIEMMVAVTIFSIVTLIVSGAFIVLADIYRKVQSNRAVIDNLNLAMDTMTLQMREGKNYTILSDRISFDEYIIIDNEYKRSGRYLTYRLKNDGSGILEQCTEPDMTEDDCNDLTSSEIVLERLYFEEQKSDFPKQILIILEGVASNKQGLESRFLLQSTLSQRNP